MSSSPFPREAAVEWIEWMSGVYIVALKFDKGRRQVFSEKSGAAL